MKKTTIFLFSLFTLAGFSQQKSTGDVTLVAGMTANLTLNNGTSTATLVLSGPNDRWFACKFGNFENPMNAGVDGVFFNGTTLIDGKEGGFSGLTADTGGAGNQNWTVQTSTLSGSTRTITATRPLNSADATDYDFIYSNNEVAFAVAYGQNANYTLNNTNKHCGSCRDVNYSLPMTVLGVEDFSLNASTVFPNPSNGNFTVKAKTNLEKVNVYSQTGAFIKSIDANNAQEVEITLSGLATGVYLIELQNASEKSWKKIMIK